MILTLPLELITDADRERVGGKATTLAKLKRLGYQVPRSLSICTSAYSLYLEETGLNSRIMMELGRKDFQQMRWEEIWDAALRIRNLFLTTPIPKDLNIKLAASLTDSFGTQPLVIRSSAPGEDSGAASFAGLHSSYVNIYGIDAIMLAVRKVWASLWSDRALLYRQELNLDINTSTMAVLVQNLINSEKSGVAFSQSPSDKKSIAVEAVYGLNQGLVDGSVEPDFWALSRQDKRVIDFRPAEKKSRMIANVALDLVSLQNEENNLPVLTDAEVTTVAETALELENIFGNPQDLEWTWVKKQLILLQARPITTHPVNDPRNWYLSLHRNLENLKQLKLRIEEEIMPGMEATARKLAGIDLQKLTDLQLVQEINKRRKIQLEWEDAYRSDCIPMAHGIRMFGEFYNDALQPDDPFEFIELLRGGDLRAVARNRELTELATAISRQEATKLPKLLTVQLDKLAESIGLSTDLTLRLLHQLANRPNIQHQADTNLEEDYLQHFPVMELPQAKELLELGRASYRLRDDDNISLDKIIREVKRAEQEAECRLIKREAACLRKALETGTEQAGLSSPLLQTQKSEIGEFRARQLQGQPASPGLATATARVIHLQEDLADFQSGEVLVCDAIDPAMTFIVPLAAGIIERRGGMLIHGAIIAREYGIPCVSGIAAAADIIKTGDRITLDGYLGLVFFPPAAGKLSADQQKHTLRKELDDAEKV